MKHTQGEWKLGELKKLPDSTDNWIYIQTPRIAMDLIAPEGMNEEEFKANAKLIAAAPIMLYELEKRSTLLSNMIKKFDSLMSKDNKLSAEDTCIEMHQWVTTMKNALESNNKAIKKATE